MVAVAVVLFGLHKKLITINQDGQSLMVFASKASTSSNLKQMDERRLLPHALHMGCNPCHGMMSHVMYGCVYGQFAQALSVSACACARVRG